MTESKVVAALKSQISDQQLFTGTSKTSYYRHGFRYGVGSASAVVFPKTLVELWRVLQICVEHGCAILPQASKTGLTGGSTPFGDDYDRELVIVNSMRIKGVYLLADATQAVALAGATLHELTEALKPHGRNPHSVIGSTSIGASIVGGIANNAGGALCKRGSSYTELALYARVNAQGKLELVNDLGIDGLGDTPEEILEAVERGDFAPENIKGWDKSASDRDYERRIRDRHAGHPNRYNADPKRLYGVSGSAGKVVAFAVRVDSYPVPKRRRVFYLGANKAEQLSLLRRHMLERFKTLPDMCEYLNRDGFLACERYGKDVFLSIKYLGTKRLPKAYALKAKVEYWLNKVPFLPKFFPDVMLHWISRCFPQHLPARLRDYRDKFEHHLLVDTSDEGIKEARQYLAEEWSQLEGVEYFECTPEEQEAALLNRFAAAGSGIRYQNIHQKTTEPVTALDIALLGDDEDWTDKIPPEVLEHLDMGLCFGHFMCHVFHRDYVFKKGTDVKAVKAKLLSALDAKGAKYPAEHNVGHLYSADENQRRFYAELDPTNTFNPGIGGTDKTRTPPLLS